MAVDKEVTGLVVDTATLAALLNLSAGRVKQMATEQVLQMSGRGKWRLLESLHAYIGFLKQERAAKTNTASQTRVRDARASEIEIRIARADREVVDLSEALQTVDDITGDYLSSVSSLPARITRDQNERRRIEAICDEERLRVSEHLSQKSLALRTGIPVAEADPEVDA